MSINYSPKIKNNNLDYYIDFSNKKSYSTNILNYSSWTVGSGSVVGTSSLYGTSGFNLEGTGTTSENIRQIGLDPFGNNTVIWNALNNEVGGTDNDGGWLSDLFTIDNTKLYRYSVWINREVLGNGLSYLGAFVYNETPSSVFLQQKSNGLTSSNTINPYFFIYNPATQSLATPYFGSLNEWTLFVGHIWPVGSATGSDHHDSGVYTIANGKIGELYSGAATYTTTGDYIFTEDSFYSRHRSYLFYSTDPTTIQKWCYPRVDIVDGTEPSIQDLLTSSDPIKDLSRNGITASFKYNSGLTSDKAMVFNGTNSITTSYIPTSIDSTFEVWCELKEDSSTFNMPFGSGLPYLSFHSPSGRFLYSTRLNGTQSYLSSNASWELNKVYHIACTTEYIGTQSSVKIFVNGVLDNQATYTGTFSNTSKIIIGNGGTVTLYKFIGNIYSLKAYREALSESDILQNFNTHKSKFGY